MAQADVDTIELFSMRSDHTVMRWTIVFAVGGALLDILARLIPMLLVGTSGSYSGLVGMWIPLCFFTIPAIHYLCRYVTRLEVRVRELESRLELRDAA